MQIYFEQLCRFLFVVILVVFLVVFAGAQALFADETGLAGNWVLQERHCLRAGQPDDSFRDGQDKLFLQVHEQHFRIKIDTKLCDFEYAGGVFVEGSSLRVVTKSTKNSNKIPNPICWAHDGTFDHFSMNHQVQEPLLLLEISGFSEANSCPSDDKMLMTFKRSTVN